MFGRRFSLSSLRFRLLFLVFIVLLPFLGFIWKETRKEYRSAEQEALSTSLRLAKKIAAEHERLIQSGHHLLQALAELTSVHVYDGKSCSNLFSKLIKAYPAFTNLGAAKLDGDVFCSGIPLTQPVNFADRSYFQQALSTQEFAVSGYLIGRIAGKRLISLAFPARDKTGQVRSIVFLGIDLSWMERIVSDTHLPEGARVVMIDRNGLVLARFPDPENMAGEPHPNAALVKTVLERHEGTREGIGLDGVERIFAFTPIHIPSGNKRMFVWVSIPTNMVFAEANRNLFEYLMGLGLTILSALTLAWTGADIFVLRKVKALLRATRQLATGDLSTRTNLPKGNGELGELAQAFDQMAESLGKHITEQERAEQAAIEQFKLAETFFNHSVSCMVILDRDFNFVRVNEAYARACRRDITEFTGRNHFDMYPSDAKLIFEEVVRTKRPFAIFTRDFVFPDQPERGVTYWDWTLVPVLDKQGEVEYLVFSLNDVTERKRSEEQAQRKTRELASLHDIDRAITSTLNLPTVLDVLLENINLHFPYSAATIRLFNSENGLLEPVACRNLNEKEWKAEQWRGGRGTPNVVFESKAPLAVRNVQSDPRVRDPGFFIKHGLVSYLGIPLIVKDVVLGVLSFYTKEEHNFSNEEIDFLSTLADQAAIAIHNARLYGDLTSSRDALEKSNRVKDEFLSVMSHELRTPLNVVVGYTGMIKDGLLGEINPQQEEALGKVINRANDQLTLVNNILHATLLESEKINIESHEVSLGDFLNQLRLAYVAPINKELTLDWDYPSELPVIKTDSAKLKQILQNLIDNAIKFTEKGSITISARIRQQAEGNRQQSPTLTPSASRLILRRAQDDPEQSRRVTPHAFVEFKVADTGVGVPKEHLGTIFEKFRQADSSETRLYGGVGMGLYIVKKFSELLGGTVEVESEPGRGSTFTVTLPLEQ